MRVSVTDVRRPPLRLEGGGFTIRDVMDGLTTPQVDPFLIWHELPRAHYGPGEMPGAPMHPHRGFNECPYAKEMSGGNSDLYGFMLNKDHTTADGQEMKMGQGDFEYVAAHS